jgi:Lsr2
MSDKRSPAARQRAADVRDWAMANELEIAARGRIPAAVYAAYDAAMATGPELDAEPGPDWAAAGADYLNLDDPDPEIDDPDPEPEKFPVAPPGMVAGGNGAAPVAEPAPPPPASLEDARERLAGGRPRVPPWAGGSRGGGGSQRPAAPPVKISAATIRDIEGKLALLAAVPVAGWEAVDPACGGALAENLSPAIKAAVPLIIQSPTALRLLTEGSTYFLWLSLAQALAPVAVTVFQHHVSHAIMVTDDGQTVAAARLPDGRVVPAADAPPVPAPDWSAYTTDVPGHVPPVQYSAG